MLQKKRIPINPMVEAYVRYVAARITSEYCSGSIPT
jgi:hypothetical protein